MRLVCFEKDKVKGVGLLEQDKVVGLQQLMNTMRYNEVYRY